MKTDPIGDADLEAAFVREFAALAARVDRFTLSVRPVDAWILLSQLQLALRHPLNTGPSAQAAMQIARRLQSIVAPHGALAIVAERGWNPEYDVHEPPKESQEPNPKGIGLAEGTGCHRTTDNVSPD